MHKFKVTYLSGQSLIMLGESLDQVTQLAEQGIAWFKIGRPHVGIASVVEVTK
jgi:hypothetical protein